jgi:DNA-binding NtrC family response regulator
MKDWQVIPEIVGCNATLRMASMQAVDAVDLGRHFVVEGEAGSGRRLLARCAWYRRGPGARSLFTLDCSMFQSDGIEALLFGERSSPQLGKFNLAMGGGLLLLHAESLTLKTQSRLAHLLDECRRRQGEERIQLLMTCTPSPHASLPLHPDLAVQLLRVRVPALRERLEDIRAIAEAFLRYASPFERIRCSQALIDRFCGYDWPGNITELRSILRRLLLEPHGGFLDVRHLADLTCRDESCFALLQGTLHPGSSQFAGNFLPHDAPPEGRSIQ